MARFVALSGPSCVGKGPLHRSLEKFYPHLAHKLDKLVLYNSRSPRPMEQDGVDYHFRPREEIEALRGQEGTIVLEVRGDLQALDGQALGQSLRGEQDAFFEGNPFTLQKILRAPALADVPKLLIYLAPLSREEILYLRGQAPPVVLPDFVTDMMRRKLLRRTQRQKGILAQPDLENIERRANSAYREMQEAWWFDYVIPNHDGEDSEHWDAFYYPIGDALKAVQAFAALLEGESNPHVEQWEEDLLA